MHQRPPTPLPGTGLITPEPNKSQLELLVAAPSGTGGTLALDMGLVEI